MASPLDLITAATSRYIKDAFDDEEDDFLDWAREVRAEAGIVDPPRERRSRGGRRLVDSIFQTHPLMAHMKDKGPVSGGKSITEPFDYTKSRGS